MRRPEVAYGYTPERISVGEAVGAFTACFYTLIRNLYSSPYLIVKVESPGPDNSWNARNRTLTDSAALLKANSAVLPDKVQPGL